MPLFSATPDIYDRNAVDFANALGEAAEGHALWDPSPIAERGGIEGDCGYFDGGRFKRLFSVYSHPRDLGIRNIPRPYGDDGIVDHVNNKNDVVLSHKSYSVQFSGDFQVPPLPQIPFLTIGCGAERSAQQQTLAFLAYCGPRRAVHKDCRLRLFENYLLQHGDAIVAKYGNTYPVTLNTLVIVYQSTRCISWFSGLKYQHSTSSNGHMGAEASGIGGNTSMKVERDQYRIPADKRGPEFWDTQAKPSYSIVLRTVAMKKRNPGTRLWRLFVAGAGFKPGDKRLDSGAAGPPHNISGPGTTNATSLNQQPSTSRSNDAADSASTASTTSPSTASTTPASTAATTLRSTPAFEPDVPNSNLVAEQRDLLSRALVQTLSERPELDVVVGSWDVVLSTNAPDTMFEGWSPNQISCRVQVEHLENGTIGRLVSDRIEEETPTRVSFTSALSSSRDKSTSVLRYRHNTRRTYPEPWSQPLLANEHIKHWEKPKGKLSPCPALNTLCNHNAYGMPRDGQGVHAAVLANAVTEVYGLNKWFSRLIVYGAVLGINKGRSLTINMQQLCEKPSPHCAVVADPNPKTEGRVEGHPDKYLVNLLVGLAQDGELSLETFAQWRNIREQNLVDNKPRFSFVHRHMAAGELALLLQVLGYDKWTVKSQEYECFVGHERLPGDQKWRPHRSIGYWSTIRVNRQILSMIAVQKGSTFAMSFLPIPKVHIRVSIRPLTLILMVALCTLGVFFIRFVGVYEGPFYSSLVSLGRSRSAVE